MKDTLFTIAVIAATLGGWLTHCITCIQDERWGMLLAGAFFFPIGIIHGWMIWFGAA